VNIFTFGQQFDYEQGLGLQTIAGLEVVTEIKLGAFFACHNLTHTSPLNSLLVIGQFAFAGCTSLRSVTAPLLEEIEASAFTECESLISLNAVDSINLTNMAHVGPNVFQNCFSITAFSGLHTASAQPV
jgi:hypothetical protein